MRIAIMQPYFIPYAGYFRLFYAVDLMIIYDCVQFIRRGWIHRNRLPNIHGELQWLTLPLKKAPQNILIKDISFAENHHETWKERLRSFPQLISLEFQQHFLFQYINSLVNTPLEYIVSTLRAICQMIDLPFSIEYSSKLNLPEFIRGEDRIIEIAKYFGAKEYINLAGGQDLYHHDFFKLHNIKLKFLSDYNGNYDSILQRLINTNEINLKREIVQQTKMETVTI